MLDLKFSERHAVLDAIAVACGAVLCLHIGGHVIDPPRRRFHIRAHAIRINTRYPIKSVFTSPIGKYMR